MSAPARRSGGARPAGERRAPRTREMSELQRRRRELRRARISLRRDVALGVICAIALLIFTPGVAFAALVALLALLVCVASFAVGRRRRSRRR